MDIIEVIKSGDYLVLDCETTGLGSNSEICQIAIIDSNANVLLDTLVKPINPIPAEATTIHGITNEMVKDSVPFSILGSLVYDLLRNRHVIIYNSKYDIQMLNQSIPYNGSHPADWGTVAVYWCAMKAFAEIYGDWNNYHQSYKWQKLSTACAYYKIPVTKSHGALEDCLSTLAVCKAMIEKHPIESTKL